MRTVYDLACKFQAIALPMVVAAEVTTLQFFRSQRDKTTHAECGGSAAKIASSPDHLQNIRCKPHGYLLAIVRSFSEDFPHLESRSGSPPDIARRDPPE